MLSIRIAIILFAIMAPIPVTGYAYATDNVAHEKHDHGDRQKQQSYYGGDGLPSYISKIGTYAGAASAVRAPRNGTYVTADGTITNRALRRSDWGRARIVRITAKTMDEACSYEAGVCVIRP